MQNPFNESIQKHETALKRDSFTFAVIGYIKLFLVIVLCVFLYFIFAKRFPGELILGAVFEFAVLAAFWVYHAKLHEAVSYSKGMIAINKRHLDRISGDWSAFDDTGEEYADTEHAYACDLDIAGKKSLFQFLNTTHTWHGRQSFANALLHPAYSSAEIQKRQKAVLELSEDTAFSCHMEYQFSKIGADGSAQKLAEELTDQTIFIKSRAIRSILTFVPLLTILFIFTIALFQLKNLYLTGAIPVLIQSVLWVGGMLKTQKYLAPITHLPYKLSAYGNVIDILKNRKFTSEKLIQIQSRLGTSTVSAAQAIKALDRISGKVNIKYNGIIYFILNVFLLWDYRCAFQFQDWKAKYAHLTEKWFCSLGDFENLLCFSILPNICSNTCLPAISNEKGTVRAKELGHPLLPNETRVNNDLTCSNHIFIISGSNMSGKTTYLRTAGINLVLARAGSFVCGKQMLFFPLNIITSMRTADDLNEGISTFYAELKRIKAIIELANKEPDMIFLIDEIFKGTNSVDRLSGARTVISKLNESAVTGMITTHDLDLCDLSRQSARIENYHFSEYYRNNKICFDYKIKPGRSTTTNAGYLMEMIGIL